MSVDEKQLELINRKNDWKPANYADGNLFVKQTPTGIVKQVMGTIRLKESQGQIAFLGNQSGWMITNEGYIACNKVAGLTSYTPQNLQVDGRSVPNPYLVLDPESGSIEKVWVRKAVVGYSPMGNLVITVSTLLYDLKMYLIEDIVKKIKKDKDAGKFCNKSSLSEDEFKNGFFLPYQGEMGIYALWNDPEISKANETFIGNKKNAERKAQTICERNAFRKHPTMPPMKITQPQNGTHVETIVGFSHQLTRGELEELAEQASREGGVDVEGAEVVEEEIKDISDDDMNAEQDEDSILNNEGGPKY